MNELPVIASCDGCGACCMEQGSPPGYVMLVQGPHLADGPGNPFADDLKRLRALPQHAIDELEAYERRLLTGKVTGDGPCLWLDLSTKQCRYYDLRPSVCRNLELGSRSCRDWRAAYRVISA